MIIFGKVKFIQVKKKHKPQKADRLLNDTRL